MAELTGSEILAKALKKEGTDNLLFIMGGPMLLAEASCIKEGIRPIDVRHEQAAALMGQAYSRLLQRPAVCMAASGPGVINLTTGLANALIDCCPVVAIGGSSPIMQNGRQVFQEIDQVAIVRGCVKWADRVYNLKRIPEQVNAAFQHAMSGKPGPTYLDFPGDVLYAKIPEEEVDWSMSGRPILNARPLGDPEQVDALMQALAKAKKPVIISGSGVIWSRAWAEMQQFVEKTGIPFYTTPQGRGVVPDDHPLSFLSMRSTAFKDADLIIVLGTRMNYIISHAAPPRFNAAAKIVRIDIDPTEIATAARKVDIGIVGDCQDGAEPAPRRARQGQGQPGPLQGLAQDAGRRRGSQAQGARRQQVRRGRRHPSAAPVRGNHATSWSATPSWWWTARRSSTTGASRCRPTCPGTASTRARSAPWASACPSRVGAKAGQARQAGDRAARRRLVRPERAWSSTRRCATSCPILVVISLNGGWTADPKREKPGRDLGYTRYDKMAETLGCHGDYVEKAEDIRPALERAQKEVDKGRVAVVNVRTDYRARAGTLQFAQYST